MKLARLLDEPLENGGIALEMFGRIISGTYSDATVGDAVGCSLQIPCDEPMETKGLLRALRTILIVEDDETMMQYRVTGVDRDRGSPVIGITGSWLGIDLGRVVLKSTVGGVLTTTLSFVNLTIAEIITDWIRPAMLAEGLDYFDAGTLEPTQRFSISWSSQTCLWLLQEIARQSQRELWLTQSVGVKQLINIGVRGIAASMPVAMVGDKVTALKYREVAGSKFYNRVYPVGDIVPGDTDESHLGQHGMKVANLPGSGVVQILNPDDPDLPIAFDDQLNGLRACVSIEAIPVDQAYAAAAILGHHTIDTTRKRVYSSLGTGDIYYYDLSDGERGLEAITLPVGSPAVITDIFYHGNYQLLFVARHDTGKVHACAYISGSWSVIQTWSVTSPNRLTLAPGAGSSGGDALVAFPDDGVTQPVSIDLDNLAVTTVITFALPTIPVCYGSAAVVYSPAANKYVFTAAAVNMADTRRVVVCDGTTGAQLNAQTIAGGRLAYGLGWDGTNVYVFYSDGSSSPVGVFFATLNLTSYVLSAGTRVTRADGIADPALISGIGFVSTISGGKAVVLGGGGYAADRPQVFRVDLSTGVLSDPLHFDGVATLRYAEAARAWIGTNGSILFSGCLQIFFENLPGNIPSVLKEMDVTDSAVPDMVTVASGELGVVEPSAVVEFRKDSAHTYLQSLEDAASRTLYKTIEAKASFSVIAKRNYYRDGLFTEWTSVNHHRYTSRYYTTETVWPDDSQKYVTADATTQLGTACQKNGAQTGPFDTINVDGLPNNAILQPGDILANAGSTTQFYVVRQRYQVSGAGVGAAIPVYPCASGTIADNTNMQWYTDELSLEQGQTACLVLGPSRSRGQSALALLSAYLGISAAVPCILGQSVAQVVIRGWLRMAGAAPSSIVLTGTGGIATSPSDATTYSDWSLQPFSLCVPVPLYGNGCWVSGVLSGLGSTIPVAYVKDIAVYLHPTSEVTLIEKPANTGDGNILWANAQRLFTQYDRSAPTASFDVNAIEVASLVGYTVGGYIRLRDPQLARASQPRVIKTDRFIDPPGRLQRLPTLTLDNRPESFLRSLLADG